MNASKSQSNIWKLYLIKALRSFMLAIPIIVLFFRENGMTMGQVFLLQSLFSVTVIFLEIPTGCFSDIFGRKASIVIGGVLATTGFMVYSQSHGFWGFLLAEIILGFGMSFISGSDSAMLYDTLLENDRALEYKRTEGRGLAFGMISESIASIIGGFLALVSLRFPLYCDALVTFLVIPVAMTLVEPKSCVVASSKRGFASMFQSVKLTLCSNGQVRWIIFYSAAVAASTLTMFWLIQPFLLANGVALEFFGIVLAALLLFASFFSWHAHSFEKIIGKKQSLILMVILPFAGYLLLGSFWSKWSILFMLLFFIVRGVNNPVTLDYINGSIPSEIRATILSVKNLISRLMFSVIGPVVGLMNDTFSLKAAFMFSGMIFLILGLIALAFLKKHKAL